jgi:hypothetical protein
VTRPKDIGTAGETAVVRYLQGFWPHAERRALRGINDAGDITGTPGISWSVKAGQAAANASDLDIDRWLAEAETQRSHANAALAVLVLKRRAYSAARSGQWWAVITVGTLTDLLNGTTNSGYPGSPVRMTLETACRLLLGAGYGGRALVSTGLRSGR